MDFETYLLEIHGKTLKQLTKELTEEAEASAVRQKTFIYQVKEVAGDDPDVTYDPALYYYKVEAVDNGEGVIETTVTRWKPGQEEDEEVEGDITFINSRTTQIKVYKRWNDVENRDGYRPTKEQFAERLHLMNGDTEVEPPAGMPKITEDKDGNLTVLYEGLPAFDDDGNKIEYTVKEDGIEHYTAQNGKDEAADGETITNVHEPETTELKITKNLPERIEGQGENATFVFRVKALATDGKLKGTVIYENTVGIEFDETSGTYETRTLTGIPVHAEIAVVEAYAGNYTPDEAGIPAFLDEDGIWKVAFNNAPNGSQFGSGIVNKYENKDGKVTYNDGSQPAGPAQEPAEPLE